MIQEVDENMKYFEKIFQLSYRRAHNYTLDLDSLKLVLLQGFKEELMETLNVLANGDIY